MRHLSVRHLAVRHLSVRHPALSNPSGRARRSLPRAVVGAALVLLVAVAAFATPDRVRATATFFAGSTTLSLDKSSASPGTGLYAGIAGIQLSEVVNDDFAPGTTHTLILLVPAGFESRHPWPRDARTGAG